MNFKGALAIFAVLATYVRVTNATCYMIQTVFAGSNQNPDSIYDACMADRTTYSYCQCCVDSGCYLSNANCTNSLNNPVTCSVPTSTVDDQNVIDLTANCAFTGKARDFCNVGSYNQYCYYDNGGVGRFTCNTTPVPSPVSVGSNATARRDWSILDCDSRFPIGTKRSTCYSRSTSYYCCYKGCAASGTNAAYPKQACTTTYGNFYADFPGYP